MKLWPKVLILTGGVFFTAVAEENSAQRLGNAQKGMAEASWPRKPDNRMSPLSGKTKEVMTLAPKIYGSEKAFYAKPALGWQREAQESSGASWRGQESSRQGWEESRWEKSRDWGGSREANPKFQTFEDPAAEHVMTLRNLPRESASDWSSRASRIGGGGTGSLRMYEGRLTRVREQVWREDEKGRDLGPGRQEKFRPEEVEKMLSQPLGDPHGASRERSPGASPLAAADN